MMLHERKFTNKIIDKITIYLNNKTKEFEEDTLIFNEPVEKYTKIKNHNGYPFLIDENGKLVYPRGLGGKIILETFVKIKNNEFYAYKDFNGKKFKVKHKQKKP